MSVQRYRCGGCGVLLTEGATAGDAMAYLVMPCPTPPAPKYEGKLTHVKRYSTAGQNTFRVFVADDGRRVDVCVRGRDGRERFAGIRDAREEARYLFAEKYGCKGDAKVDENNGA